jgi:hypothetical protein
MEGNAGNRDGRDGYSEAETKAAMNETERKIYERLERLEQHYVAQLEAARRDMRRIRARVRKRMRAGYDTGEGKS